MLTHPSCDRSIEAEHLRLTWEETRVKDAIKRSVPPHQLRPTFWPNPGSARQFVGRITAERNEVRHLFWIDAISLPDLLGPDPRNFAAPRREEDRCALRGELKSIPIAARH